MAAHPRARAFTPNDAGDPRIRRAPIRATHSGVEVYSIKFHIEGDGRVILDDPNLPVLL